MTDYKLQIVNAAFIASGVATQAKGVLYRHRSDKGRNDQKVEDYRVETAPGWQMPRDTGTGESPINKPEDEWAGGADYWLGRTALTDLVIKVPGEGNLLINDATVSVSMQKLIVSTAIVGRTGTIKEYICDGDYQINISVGLVATDACGALVDQYPERAVTQLREILERPDALEVSSMFLDIFGITHMVVTGFSAKQMTHSNRQVIEITALSDSDYVISSTDY